MSKLWVCLLVIVTLSACHTAVTTPTPTQIARATDMAVFPTATDTAHPPTATSHILPTNTPTATRRPTQTPTTAPIFTATPTVASSLTNTPPPAPTEVGFHLADFAKFPVQEMWIAPSGHLWVDSEVGLWEYTTENVFRQRTQTMFVQILGADTDGRIWVLFDEGQRIAYHISGTEWASFGVETGWESAVGHVHSDIVTDSQGGLWLALGQDGLRHFDTQNQQWTTLRAADVGFAPPPAESGDGWSYAPHLSFTDVVIDSFGNVWTAACPVRMFTDGPIATQFGSGEGARWFNGAEWAGSEQIADRCVMDLEMDGNGRIWLSGKQNDLWTGNNDFVRYDPQGGVWEHLPVPTDEARYEGRPVFVSEMGFDSAGNAWLLVEVRGGASFPLPMLFRQQNDNWVLAVAEQTGNIWFDAGGHL